jgi:peptidoglycan/LPS O-acetylase OafA/YrhL
LSKIELNAASDPPSARNPFKHAAKKVSMSSTQAIHRPPANADALHPMSTVASASAYRADIDGMRAFSVLAVIAYHINKHLLPAGFVGVDIFFVISGYLISAHIFSGAAAGKFSFIDFYFRRIRRIAPAMMVVLTVTLLAAQYLLLPDDAKGAAKSAVWSLASMANVYFWLFQDGGYFAGSSNLLPLLHLWSLGVEEQFYLFWPVIAIVMVRLRVNLQMALMLAAIIASTIFAQLSFVDSPSFVYFMLPSRCAELLIGAILALAVVSGKTAAIPQRLALPIALAGAAMVLASAMLISEFAVFPGLLALPPTIGAAMIILAGGIGANGVSNALSVRPLRWIGLLSYPAYLWHWPLLAFYRYGYGEPGVVSGMALVLLTFLLSWLTYRYVELPAKQVPALRWKACYAAFAACSFTLAVAASIFYFSDRLFPLLRDTNYGRQLAAARAQNVPTAQSDVICLRKELTAADLSDPKCVHGSGPAPASRVLLMGDSNAAHYVGIVSTFATHGQFQFRNLAVGSCPPIIGEVGLFVPSRRLQACVASQKIWESAIADAEVLILGGTWNSYQNASPTFMPRFLAQVRAFVAMGKQVVILGKVPMIEAYDRLCKEKAIRYPLMQCEAPVNAMPVEMAGINAELRRFAADTPGVRYYDIESVICPGGKCSAYGEDRQSLYFDPQHLSAQGSMALGQKIHATAGVPAQFSFGADKKALAAPM